MVFVCILHEANWKEEIAKLKRQLLRELQLKLQITKQD
jgi:hypothetical protein